MTTRKNSLTANLGLVNMSMNLVTSGSYISGANYIFSFDDLTGSKSLLYTQSVLTLHSIKAVLDDGTANVTIYYSEDRSDDNADPVITFETSNTTTGEIFDEFNQSVIPKNSWMWLVVHESEDVNRLDLIINY
jgi:hypothetical protein